MIGKTSSSSLGTCPVPKIKNVMNINLIFCRKYERLHDVIARMIEHDIKYLPLVDKEGRVISDLDILDLLELWLKKEEEIF